MLLDNAPCVECMYKGLCFLLKHRNIIATTNRILLLKPSFVISQGQPCWHTFHALITAKNKRPIKCVKPKLNPLYFHSSHAWYAWLLHYKIQQFFLECVILQECNNNFAFPSHSSVYTAILNIHCFFFPLVYNDVIGTWCEKSIIGLYLAKRFSVRKISYIIKLVFTLISMKRKKKTKQNQKKKKTKQNKNKTKMKQTHKIHKWVLHDALEYYQKNWSMHE